MTSGSDPFDFSDFGGRASAGAHPTDARPRPYSTAGGFDPFADEPSLLQQTADKPFGASAGETTAPLAVTRPPLALVIVALAFAAVGIALGVVAVYTGSAVPAFTGWLLAGPVAIGTLARFTHLDTRRRVSSLYSAPTWLSAVYWVVVAPCAVGIGIGAWQIALWAGRW